MPSSAAIQLYYFPFGGRAGTTRLLLNHGNVPFDDVRIPYSDFDEVVAANPTRFPLQTLPVMEIAGSSIPGESAASDDKGVVRLSQSLAIASLAAKLAGLYPPTARLALLNDEIMFTIMDVAEPMAKATEAPEGGARNKACAEVRNGPLVRGYNRLEALLGEGSAEGPFLCGAKPTSSDFDLHLMEFWMEAYPTQFPVEEIHQPYPRVRRVLEAVKALDSVKAFKAKHPRL